MWAEKEMHNLIKMSKFGIPVPEVVLLKKHILVKIKIWQFFVELYCSRFGQNATALASRCRRDCNKCFLYKCCTYILSGLRSIN